MVARAIATCVIVLSACGVARGQDIDLPQVSVALPSSSRAGFTALRLKIVERLDAHNTKVDDFVSRCGSIPAGQSARQAACAKEYEHMQSVEAALIAEKKRFSAELARAVKASALKEIDAFDQMNVGFEWGGTPRTDPPVVRRTREAVFVAGTGWVQGFVRRENPRLEKMAEAEFERAKKLAGVTEFMDPKDYDMLIGVAASHSFAFDLLSRVVGGPLSFAGDQTTLGEYSAASAPLYASLRGTQTPRLDCHSNGAMVCLAALRLGDVTGPKDSAGKTRLDVKLYGPQLTPRAVAEWQKLLNQGKVSSIEITITEGDPIAPASYAVGDMPWMNAAVRIATVLAPLPMGKLNLSAVDFFSPQAAASLKDDIQRTAPGIRVNVNTNAACREKLALAASTLDAKDAFVCHDAKIYTGQ